MDVEDITNLGSGLGRVALPDGSRWVVMVPKVLVGEKVRVRVYQNHDSYSEADLLEVLTSSPDRVTPLCPYFQTCGGCQYQHMSIAAQRRWKKAQVVSGLQRIGGLPVDEDAVRAVIGTDHHFEYRTKITPHYDTPRKATPIGFLQRGSRMVIDIPQCLIASPAINTKLTAERARITNMIATNPPKKGATLLLREVDDGQVVTDNNAIVQQTVRGLRFRTKAGEFFQNNPYVLPLMVEHVIQQAVGEGECRYLIDTYCGCGLFALCAAQRFDEVYGVEVSANAVRSAKDNALLNSITNTQFVEGSAEAIFCQLQQLPAQQTVIVIDPPRKGCDQVFLDQLFAFRPRRLVYVSCDPATQARDAKLIVAQGYHIKEVQPFDLFPQTRHIENVMTFELPAVIT